MRDTLEKVFNVLELVASCDKPISMKEICEKTGYHPSTASRILADLVEMGYVRKESYRDFILDLGLVPLGQKALSHFPLSRFTGPLIAETASKLTCEGALAGMHRERLVYLYRGSKPLDGATSEDFRYPLYRSNCGVVILAGETEEEAKRLLTAELSAESKPLSPTVEEFMRRREKARRNGYALTIQENHWNVAFPISYGGRKFSVALYGQGDIQDRLEKITLECSLLAGRVQSFGR
jgi:DNA-binding IclR family transcriptional regulator